MKEFAEFPSRTDRLWKILVTFYLDSAIFIIYMLPLKSSLHQACINQVESKIATLEKAIQDAQQAASEDTKSSAGDKFETSREMMKLEINKNGLQLKQALEMMRYLNQINPETQKDTVGFGSLISTNEGIYYFSVSLGKVKTEDQSFFALSMASPIGKALANKKAGDEITFMGRTIRIEEIG